MHVLAQRKTKFEMLFFKKNYEATFLRYQIIEFPSVKWRSNSYYEKNAWSFHWVSLHESKVKTCDVTTDYNGKNQQQ